MVFVEGGNLKSKIEINCTGRNVPYTGTRMNLRDVGRILTVFNVLTLFF